MQVTDLKAILDYEHNEQWLAALNCYKGIWDHNPTDDVAIRYCFFCWYLIWQREQIDFPERIYRLKPKLLLITEWEYQKRNLSIHYQVLHVDITIIFKLSINVF